LNGKFHCFLNAFFGFGWRVESPRWADGVADSATEDGRDLARRRNDSISPTHPDCQFTTEEWLAVPLASAVGLDRFDPGFQENTPMKALILAAGRGRRLWPFTADLPKCLLLLDGVSILEHQLRHLEQVGIREVVLVCGFGIERIRGVLSARSGHLRVKMLYNPFYAVSDNLISLWAARSEMDGDFVLLNGDNVFHPGILQCLVEVEDACCLMVGRKPAYDDDDMKVKLQEDRIIRIGKHLSPEATDAESVGIMRFRGDGVDLIRQVLDEIVQEERALRSYFLDCIQGLVDEGHRVTYRDIDGLPWADVDTPEDLRFVRQHLHLYQAQVPYQLYGEVRGGA